MPSFIYNSVATLVRLHTSLIVSRSQTSAHIKVCSSGSIQNTSSINTSSTIFFCKEFILSSCRFVGFIKCTTNISLLLILHYVINSCCLTILVNSFCRGQTIFVTNLAANVRNHNSSTASYAANTCAYRSLGNIPVFVGCNLNSFCVHATTDNISYDRSINCIYTDTHANAN